MAWGCWEDAAGVVQFGLFRGWGVLDYAGGTVVHTTSGFSALAAAIVVGKPRHDFKETPHSLPLVYIGTALLWFGWNGFNGGSALGAADGYAALATVNTTIAAAMGGIMWVILDTIYGRGATGIGAMTGAVVGLVCITLACGFVSPLSALAFGIAGACGSFFSIKYLKFGVSDTLDCFFCHGISGVVGTIMVGLFAEQRLNIYGKDGLFFGGGGKLLGVQALSVFIVAIWSFVFTFVLLTLFKYIPGLGLRPTEDQEEAGLDVSMHGNNAYVEAEEIKGHKHTGAFVKLEELLTMGLFEMTEAGNLFHKAKKEEFEKNKELKEKRNPKSRVTVDVESI